MRTKTLKSKATIKVPCVESFADYHDIFSYGDELRGQYENIKCEEIAFDGRYWALVFLKNEKPTQKELQELLEKSGFWYVQDHIIYKL